MARSWAAEAAGAEGNLEKAAQDYLAASFACSDPAIARRATEVAITAQSWDLAGMAADRWVLLAPAERGGAQNRGAGHAGQWRLCPGRIPAGRFAGSARRTGRGPVGRKSAQLLTAGQNAERVDRLLDHLVPAQAADDNPYALLARSQSAARGGDMPKLAPG